MGIKVDDYLIDTPVEEIIDILRKDLLVSFDVNRFEKVRRTGDNVMIQCPFHKEGQETKPSMGISDEGECHCFTCGWSGSLDRFISNLYGYEDNGKYGKYFLLSRLDSFEMPKREIHLAFEKPDITEESKDVIEDSLLAQYRYTHPYMYERHLTDKLIDFFDIGYDCDTNSITFPIKDIDGDVVFVAMRSIQYKYFSLPANINKPVYGAYLFKSGKYSKAVICESVFNALTCWKFGIPAMALMGTGSKYQMDILRNLPVRHYVLGLDPDEAGDRGVEKIKRYLGDCKLLSKYLYKRGDSRDINDLDSDILNLETILI